MAYMFSGSQKASSFVKHLKKRASFFEKLASFLHTVVNEKASSLWKLARFLVKWSLDLWTKQHGGQGIDRRKMHSFEFGHLRGDCLGLNIVLRSFVTQRWISMKYHTTLCLHAEFVATHAKPPLSLISRWNKEHGVDFRQPPDISRSHLYRGTFPWTPTTAIYRAYTVYVFTDLKII